MQPTIATCRPNSRSACGTVTHTISRVCSSDQAISKAETSMVFNAAAESIYLNAAADPLVGCHHQPVSFAYAFGKSTVQLGKHYTLWDALTVNTRSGPHCQSDHAAAVNTNSRQQQCLAQLHLNSCKMLLVALEFGLHGGISKLPASGAHLQLATSTA